MDIVATAAGALAAAGVAAALAWRVRAVPGLLAASGSASAAAAGAVRWASPPTAPGPAGGLADRSIAIMRQHGVAVEVIRAVDHAIAFGVYPDMTEHGWERDDWPPIAEKVMTGRHPRADHADLAGREVVGLHAG